MSLNEYQSRQISYNNAVTEKETVRHDIIEARVLPLGSGRSGIDSIRRRQNGDSQNRRLGGGGGNCFQPPVSVSGEGVRPADIRTSRTGEAEGPALAGNEEEEIKPLPHQSVRKI